jgi:hypothetical protein
MPHTRPSDVTFLGLSSTVFCVECELISYNNSPQCLSCGSKALLSLPRVLGGALNGQPRATLVSNEALDGVVKGILGEVMRGGRFDDAGVDHLGSRTAHGPMTTFKQHTNSLAGAELTVRAVLDRACTIGPATGAVLALRSGEKMICAATMGSGVPEIGSEVGSNGSLSALCVKTGMTLRCDSAEHDARVDQQSCRELGIESVVAAPVAYMNQVVGLLEIFSEQKYAFANHDVAKVQVLASLVLIALMKSSELLAISGTSGMQ